VMLTPKMVISAIDNYMAHSRRDYVETTIEA
jgi:hypothetical protein